ncbi:MAG: hypothetical protein M1825_002620 [Sarcosagium campestre]|nr:MAG: hypothetical protein M1825_002620 [Sarcosagium campestre]
MSGEGNEKLPVKLSLPLGYQQELFQELKSEDELVVLARGLGLLRIVTNLLHAYDAAGDNFVLLVGAEDRENDWIGEALLDADKITGIVALHADRIVATSTEAFILRIFRQKNKNGFLKAFSDSPEPLTTGFSPLATMMRNLFLRKASLWPRFHLSVAKSLEGRKKAEVIELEVPMTDAVSEIQTAILECAEISYQELRKTNAGLDLDEWKPDMALHRNFDLAVRRQLDPVWHRVSAKTRQIANDLTVLRQMLHYLLTYDAVSFNTYLDTIIATQAPPSGSTRQNQSPWLFLDAAHTIFDTARRRVYTGKVNESVPSDGTSASQDSLRPVLEELPKWALLAEILDEIERDAYFNPRIRDDSNGTILIMCTDGATCRQIKEFLQTRFVRAGDVEEDEDDTSSKPTADFMMRRKLRQYLKWKPELSKATALLSAAEKSQSISTDSRRGADSYRAKGPPNKRRRVRGGAAAASGSSRTADGSVTIPEDGVSQVIDLLAEVEAIGGEAQQKKEILADPLDDMEDHFQILDMNDLIVVHPYDGDMDEHVLEEVKPRYVVMYEPDAAFIRRVEVYRSSHNDRNVRVYFMYYGGSAEEHRYLSAVRREKDAFTRLIKEKGSMAVTLTLDGKGVDDPQEQFLRTVNTRIAGGGRLAATAQQPRVVIDLREFRSSLPSLLHAQSMQVVPCLLTVGDYILTPQICVERKSIKDLISSFKDGRLYNQAETMLQHYKDAVLLIEFDQNKSFTLDPFADFSKGTSATSAPSDLQSKLVLLSIAFPQLRIVWSSSPYQSALIFAELKKSAEEPDPIAASRVGLQFGEDVAAQTFSQVPQEMLRMIPGVTEPVAKALVLEVESLLHLANMELSDVEALIGREAARQMDRFLGKNFLE